jgi:hypothetical protein
MTKLNIKSLVIGIIIGCTAMVAIPAYAEVSELIAKENPYKLTLNGEEYAPASIQYPVLSYDSKSYTALAFVFDLCKDAGISYKVDTSNKTINFTTTTSSLALKTSLNSKVATTMVRQANNISSSAITSNEEIGGGYAFKTPPTSTLPEGMVWTVYSIDKNNWIKYWCVKYNNDIYMERDLALANSGCKIRSTASNPYVIKNTTKIPYNSKDTTQLLKVNNHEYLNYSWLVRTFK